MQLSIEISKAQVESVLSPSFLTKSLIWLSPLLTNWSIANANGWKLRSQWKKEGVVIPKDQPPVGLIVKKYGQFEPDCLGQPWEICFAKCEKHSYWFDQGFILFCHPDLASNFQSETLPQNVISVSNCQEEKQQEEEGKFKSEFLSEKSAKKCAVTISKSHPPEFSITLPPFSLPYMRMESSEEQVGVRVTPTRQETKKFEVKNRKSYIPEGLNLPQDYLFRDEIFYVCGLIYWKQMEKRSGAEEFIRLQKQAMREQVGIQAWSFITKHCLGTIFERDNWYSKGVKCYGYRLHESLRGQAHRLVDLERKSLIKKINQTEVALKTQTERTLKENLFEITIDPQAREDFQNHHDSFNINSSIQAIEDQQFYLKPDSFSRRLHSNLTNLKKELRPYLRVQGQSLKEIDIPNSQPVFLAVSGKASGKCDDNYLKLVEQGVLYEHVARRIGLTRESAKHDTLVYLYEDPDPKGISAKAVKYLFEKDFPLIAKFVVQTKVRDSNRLCRLMQKAEREFLINRCCKKLVNNQIWCATIHDSILSLPEDSEAVLEVVRGEFTRIGIDLSLRAKNV